MASGILPIVKQAAIDAVNNSNPTDLRYGTVISINPIKIKITNNFILPSSVLVVPKRLREDDPLQLNDKVALIRQLGGASYFILDKI